MRTKFLVTLLATLLTLTLAGQPRRGRALRPEAPAPAAVSAATPETKPSRRLALVIGNDAYAQAGRLTQAANDARKFAAALTATGFSAENVHVALDANLVTLKAKIEQFLNQIAAGDIVFVFYSGHAIEVAGENYLLPVDYPPQTKEALVSHHAYSAQGLLSLLDGSAARVRVLILDACRNNPFRSGRGRSGGLAAMEPGQGSVVIYSTGAGQIAADNGLFTTHFAASMRTFKGPFDGLVKDVARKVHRANRDQLPVQYGIFIEDFYLNGPPAGTRPENAQATQNEPAAAATCATITKLLDEARNAEAEVQLGELRPNGCKAAARIAAFLERTNAEQARLWYQAAAQTGDATAHRWLGERSLTANQYDQARQHYVAAAEKGDAASFAIAGMLCLRGQGGPIDYPRAHRYLQSAGAQQDQRGLFWLGVAHARALGVPQDLEGARQYLRRSASLGYRPAQDLLEELNLPARAQTPRRQPEVIY